jgi:hypothetical protein
MVASILAVAVTLPGGARPAQAFDPQATINTSRAVSVAVLPTLQF